MQTDLDKCNLSRDCSHLLWEFVQESNYVMAKCTIPTTLLVTLLIAQSEVKKPYKDWCRKGEYS